MTGYHIEFYETENGTAPAEEFIKSLDDKMIAKVLRVLNVLEINGPMVRMPYSRMLNDGIFEIRAQQGSDIVRILYFYSTGKRIVLTHGFIKKSQKTPAHEIERARRYREVYERKDLR